MGTLRYFFKSQKKYSLKTNRLRDTGFFQLQESWTLGWNLSQFTVTDFCSTALELGGSLGLEAWLLGTWPHTTSIQATLCDGGNTLAHHCLCGEAPLPEPLPYLWPHAQDCYRICFTRNLGRPQMKSSTPPAPEWNLLAMFA